MRFIRHLAEAILLLSSLHLTSLQAQVVLNEVCVLNGGVLIDEDSTNSDWVELYNAGSSTIDLQGWMLSDRFYEPERGIFPSYQLTPGSYLVNPENPLKQLKTLLKLVEKVCQDQQ